MNSVHERMTNLVHDHDPLRAGREELNYIMEEMAAIESELRAGFICLRTGGASAAPPPS